MTTQTTMKPTKTLEKKSEKKPAADPVKHDVIVLLKLDHTAVKKLFNQYDQLAKQGNVTAKVKIANQICAELIVHTRAEEEVFYPPALAATHEDAMFNEADVEHDSAKDLMLQILSMDARDPMYDAKLTVLGEYITHHVDEEESEMFPLVRETKALDLKQLGEKLKARKDALMATLQNAQGALDPQRISKMLGVKRDH